MPERDASHLGDILAVWAHPDDENYLCGGIMAAAARAGSRVVDVTATLGEEGVQDVRRWPAERLGEIRLEELRRALRTLGVGEPVLLGYRDGTAHTVDVEEAIEKLRRTFEDVQPDTVLTFGPDTMTGHLDHGAVSMWTSEAFRRYAKSGAHLHYACLSAEHATRFPEILGNKDIWGDNEPPLVARDELSIEFALDDALLEMKWRAALCHESQIGPLLELYGEDTFKGWTSLECFRLGATK